MLIQCYEKMSELQNLINTYDTRIEYISDILITTSYPADHLIKELNTLKNRKKELISEFNCLHLKKDSI